MGTPKQLQVVLEDIEAEAETAEGERIRKMRSLLDGMIENLQGDVRNAFGADRDIAMGSLEAQDRFDPSTIKLYVYQNLTALASGLIAQMADGPRRLRLEYELHMHIINQCNLDLVRSLARSDQYHAKLGALFRDLECGTPGRLRKATVHDHEIMCISIKTLLESPEGRANIVSLEDEDANSFFNLLQKFLFDPGFTYLDARSHKVMCRAGSPVIIKLAQRFHRLPDKFLIEGAELCQPDPVKGGGFADIYVGKYLGRTVALKRLRIFNDSHNYDSTKILKKFLKEALVWQNFLHPNVVPLLGIDAAAFSRKCLTMVSPWMNNRDITTYMKQNMLTVEDCNRLLFEVANGLSYLHGQDIIHGDMRGGNILIDDNSHACLTDFGLAGFADAALIASTTSTRSGSTGWMAPELLSPEKYHVPFRRTKASDVYAYGCVCLEVYTERPPFWDIPQMEAVLRVLDRKRPDRPTVVSCGRLIHDELWKAIELCWQEKPARRPFISQLVATLREKGVFPSLEFEESNLTTITTSQSPKPPPISGVDAMTQLPLSRRVTIPLQESRKRKERVANDARLPPVNKEPYNRAQSVSAPPYVRR